MLGFLIGTACLIGFVKVARGGHRWHAHHGTCGPHHGWRGRGPGRRWFLRGLFERLDTTPGQEKAVMAALDELRQAASGVRPEAKQTRADVAHAVRGEHFDAEAMGGVFARHDQALESLRKAFVGAIAKIHDALDARQRQILAELLESGPGFRGWAGGPYRSWS